jgi:hypothetical protein
LWMQRKVAPWGIPLTDGLAICWCSRRFGPFFGDHQIIVMGTLGGFPNPPAMVRGERSSPAPHTILSTASR